MAAPALDEEVYDEYRRSDLFVFTSMRETVPTVIIEALAAGLPVVYLDHHGLRDMVPPQCGVGIAVTTPRRVIADLAPDDFRVGRRRARPPANGRGRLCPRRALPVVAAGGGTEPNAVGGTSSQRPLPGAGRRRCCSLTRSCDAGNRSRMHDGIAAQRAIGTARTGEFRRVSRKRCVVFGGSFREDRATQGYSRIRNALAECP